MLSYIETIKGALKPTGYWINIGPLQYHFEGMENSVEFTHEEFESLVNENGFEILTQDWVKSCYASNPNYMLQHVYNNWFFVSRRII